jgi:hypothetical protein
MDDLGKSLPAAEAMVDAEQSSEKKTHINEECLNCGTVLIDSYCHHCGQKDIPRRQTLGDMLSNFVSSFWSYEGKFFRTTRYLITSPGFLATEYNAGRRESYYHPARMYVFISFIFFLVYFSLPDGGGDIINMKMDKGDIKEMRKDMSKYGLDTIPKWRNLTDSLLVANAKVINDSLSAHGEGDFSLGSNEYKTIAEYDSIEMTKPLEERDGWLERRLEIRTLEVNQKYKGKQNEFISNFGQMMKDNFSKVAFWLLPFFALLLKLLYVRRDFYYSEHLVLTIYYYNFFFLAGSVILLVNLVPGIGFVGPVLSFWVYLYFLFAMKHMYKQSWRKTIAKFLIFTVLFGTLMGIGFLVMIVSVFFVI